MLLVVGRLFREQIQASPELFELLSRLNTPGGVRALAEFLFGPEVAQWMAQQRVAGIPPPIITVPEAGVPLYRLPWFTIRFSSDGIKPTSWDAEVIVVNPALAKYGQDSLYLLGDPEQD